jgi:hypothetical protein
MKRMMKLSSLSFLTAPMLFASGCLITRDDVQDAIAAPITDAISDVVAAILTGLLTSGGVIPA